MTRSSDGDIRHLIIPFFCLIILSVTVHADQMRVQSYLADMTLRQKVSQMFMVSFYGTQLTETERIFLSTYHPGAAVLFGKNIDTPQQVTQLTNDYQQIVTDADGIPLFIAVDQEGGRIQHLREGFTDFPLPMLWTATQNTELAYQIGRAMATEMRAVGVNMNLAPVADLNTNIDNPIIGTRAFGSDIELVTPILTHFIRGLQENGVMATAKHFPGHGDTSSDSHVELPRLDYGRERLDYVELQPFMSAIEAGVDVTMVSHVWFTAFDEKEVPASLSNAIVTGLLRNELSYDGIIMTDALDMDAIDTVYSPGGAAIQAILAGNDMIAIGAHVGTATIEEAITDVVSAVEDGTISIDQINASVERILLAKEKYGVLDWQRLDPNTVSDRLNLDAHDELVTTIFEQGVTLVGDASEVVPLSGKVAIIYLATRPKIAQECAGINGEVTYVGISATPSDDEIGWAVSAGAAADTVVVFTQNADENVRQQELVNALPAYKTIVVALWDTRDMQVFPDVKGYLLGYSPMLRATSVICDILVGELPAKGMFPITFID